MNAYLETIGGQPVLRFERRLAHPVEKVWKAVTDPAEMAHWFPASVQTELRVGAPMRFTFPDAAPVEGTDEGEILEFDPPTVYAFRWNQDVLRFELVPDGAGCRLSFSHTLGGGPLGRLGAGRSAAGWDHCLDALGARLDGRTVEPFTEWLPAIEHYVAWFGLDEGRLVSTGDGAELRFVRDLVWKPVQEVWQLLVGDEAVEVGGKPPLCATHGYLPAGAVTAVEAPRLLEYEWLHGGAPAGRVRFEIASDPEFGVRVELTQTVPSEYPDVATALAAWHTHLELFFAAVHGEIRCPWPADRTEQLTRHYTAALPTP